MSTTTLNARLKVRYDTLANWESSTSVLLAGEIAVATVPKANPDNLDPPPAPDLVIKVGDGYHKFSQLEFLQADAADVFAWAKGETKPSYAAAEIAIADSAGNTDTTTVEAALAEIYGLIDNLDSASTITQNDVDTAIAAVTGTPDTNKTLQDEIDDVETAIGTLNGNSSTTGSVANTVNAAITALNLATTYAAIAYETKVDTLIGNVSGDDALSVREIAAAEVAKIVASADSSYDTLKEIADWILNDTTGAAKMANDITALKTKVTLGTYDDNGTQTEYATVAAYVAAAIASEATDRAAVTGTPDTGKTLQSEIDDVEAAITTLNANSSTTGSVDKKIADAIGAIDIAVAANGQNETNKVLTAFEIANGSLVTNSIGTKTLATIATTGKATDLTTTSDDYIVLEGGTASSYPAPAQS